MLRLVTKTVIDAVALIMLTSLPGGMSLDQLRAAYSAEIERCEAQMALCPTQDARYKAFKVQRSSAIRLRAAITPLRQLELEV